jgi:hypothetical protein
MRIYLLGFRRERKILQADQSRRDVAEQWKLFLNEHQSWRWILGDIAIKATYQPHHTEIPNLGYAFVGTNTPSVNSSL